MHLKPQNRAFARCAVLCKPSLCSEILTWTWQVEFKIEILLFGLMGIEDQLRTHGLSDSCEDPASTAKSVSLGYNCCWKPCCFGCQTEHRLCFPLSPEISILNLDTSLKIEIRSNVISKYHWERYEKQGESVQRKLCSPDYEGNFVIFYLKIFRCNCLTFSLFSARYIIQSQRSGFFTQRMPIAIIALL